MIDIHSHIIPFVDDGSKSLEDSIEMIKNEIASGVDTIIATPHHIIHHYIKSVEEITKNFNILVEECQKQNLNIKLYLGQEIYYTKREDIALMLENKEILTMNNTRTILLEFPTTHPVDEPEEVIYNFKLKGYDVIVAHVERYCSWMSFDQIKAMIESGAKIQINSGAIIGKDGFKMKRLCKKLLKNNMVNYIASDVHSFRQTTISKAFKKVKNEALFNNYELVK